MKDEFNRKKEFEYNRKIKEFIISFDIDENGNQSRRK